MSTTAHTERYRERISVLEGPSTNPKEEATIRISKKENQK